MNFDITITSTIRPEIYEKCLKSIIDNIINCNNNFDIRLLINIDPIGETDSFDQKTIEEITKKYYKNSIFIKPTKPNFPIAVKNLWNLVESDFVMHTEDDRLFTQKINLTDIIEKFIIEKNTGVIWIQGKINRLKSFGFSVIEKNDYWIVNNDKKTPKCLLTLNPCIYRKEMVKGLTKYIRNGASPEKVLRLQDVSQLNKLEIKELENFINKWNYLIYKNHDEDVYSVDIGRTWRKKMGFVKNSKDKLKSVTETWIKI